jgi:putative N6-adenine-specific DNA methylase
VLAGELGGIDATGITPGRGAITFTGGPTTLYRANLELRTAMRVLLPLASGPVGDREALYRLAVNVRWEELVPPGATFAVEAVGRHPNLAAHFAAVVVKDAVADRLRRVRGKRPDVDRSRPDLGLHLRLEPESASLSLDASGEPLSHRGYRPAGGPAPLAESLAAGILLLAGYDGSQSLLDPMCGTGTLAVEAALIATRTAPGIARRFACERWPGHDPALLMRLRDRARAQTRPAAAAIYARDLDPTAVAATRRNLGAAGMAPWVRVETGDLDLAGLSPGSLVVTNPPYGHRIGEVDDLRPLYRRLGDQLKRHAAGSTAFVLVGERELARELRLAPRRKIVLFNGPIECRLLAIDVVAGSHRG